MCIRGHKRIPSDRPVRSRTNADRMLQRNVAGSKLCQFVVTAMSVHQEDPGKAVRCKRPQKFAKHAVVGFRTDRERAAEDKDDDPKNRRAEPA